MWYYASHLGGMYGSEVELSEDDLFCEACQDSDLLIGFFDSEAEARMAFEDGAY